MPDNDERENRYITDVWRNLDETRHHALRRFGWQRHDAITVLAHVAYQLLNTHHAERGQLCHQCDEPFPCHTYNEAARILDRAQRRQPG
jgi:uncharacterized CHY-type Zn-finger protein